MKLIGRFSKRARNELNSNSYKEKSNAQLIDLFKQYGNEDLNMTSERDLATKYSAADNHLHRKVVSGGFIKYSNK